MEYSIPYHLKGIKDIGELRNADLEVLEKELQGMGSSVDQKIEEGSIWRMGFPGMILDVKKVNVKGDDLNMYVSPIHPHRADLSYKRVRMSGRNVTPLTANALSVLRDTSILVGVRGGVG